MLKVRHRCSNFPRANSPVRLLPQMYRPASASSLPIIDGIGPIMNDVQQRLRGIATCFMEGNMPRNCTYHMAPLPLQSACVERNDTDNTHHTVCASCRCCTAPYRIRNERSSSIFYSRLDMACAGRCCNQTSTFSAVML